MVDTFVQEKSVVALLENATDAAGRTSAYISLKNAIRVVIIARVYQGNAAQVTFSLLQATAVAGTSSKAGPSVSIWTNQDALASHAMTKQTDAASYQLSTTTSKDKMVVMEFSPAQLDSTNGFDCIAISTSASNAGNLTSAVAIIHTAYQQTTPPSVLTD